MPISTALDKTSKPVFKWSLYYFSVMRNPHELQCFQYAWRAATTFLPDTHNFSCGALSIILAVKASSRCTCRVQMAFNSSAQSRAQFSACYHPSQGIWCQVFPRLCISQSLHALCFVTCRKVLLANFLIRILGFFFRLIMWPGEVSGC